MTSPIRSAPVEPTQERIDALEYKVAVAYQIVGALFHGVKYTDEDQLAAQDFLAYDDAPDPLPWPKNSQKADSAPTPTSSDEDREAVAKAIWESIQPRMPAKFTDLAPNIRESYRAEADAAIKTLIDRGWGK